jgi:Fe2+ or Zn2+ uptake regulation protein
MKLLLDDKTTRGYNLNANEACIFAAILKCTRSGRGWYGNYRELAAAMPFVINRTTVYRAIQKLLNLGLIEERENKTLFAVQIAQESVQNEHENVQNAQECVQSALPPNNPPINNNMNENQLSSPAQDARTEEKKTEENLDFMDFWFLFSAPKDMLNRENACRRLWESTTFSRAKKQAIIKELTNHQMNGTFTEERNPFFYLNNFPEPQPVFLRGDESGDIVQVRYNGAYKLCTRKTMELFNLEWVRDW